MGNIKQIKILNQTYCFFNDTINIKKSKIDQKLMQKHLCLLN